jgi:hypothetical protein
MTRLEGVSEAVRISCNLRMSSLRPRWTSATIAGRRKTVPPLYTPLTDNQSLFRGIFFDSPPAEVYFLRFKDRGANMRCVFFAASCDVNRVGFLPGQDDAGSAGFGRRARSPPGSGRCRKAAVSGRTCPRFCASRFLTGTPSKAQAMEESAGAREGDRKWPDQLSRLRKQ